MVSEKIVRISTETAEICRVKLGPSAQNCIACINAKSSQVSQKIINKFCYDKLCPNVLK